MIHLLILIMQICYYNMLIVKSKKTDKLDVLN